MIAFSVFGFVFFLDRAGVLDLSDLEQLVQSYCSSFLLCKIRGDTDPALCTVKHNKRGHTVEEL